MKLVLVEVEVGQVVNSKTQEVIYDMEDAVVLPEVEKPVLLKEVLVEEGEDEILYITYENQIYAFDFPKPDTYERQVIDNVIDTE